ncbi:MAG: DMT family transporter [Thaumarchaeota archaeon]|nr:DMT family transporter [Nitrososphaerota archaeon]
MIRALGEDVLQRVSGNPVSRCILYAPPKPALVWVFNHSVWVFNHSSNVGPSPSKRGYLYALGAAIFGGTIPALSKLLVATTGPLVISSLVFLIGGLVLLPYKPRKLPTGRGILLIPAIGIMGALAAPVLYLYGIQHSTAVNASLLTNSEVFFTALIAFVVFHEKLKRKQIVSSQGS